MPRGIDPILIAEFKKAAFRPCYLVELGTRVPKYIWTGVHDLEWEGKKFQAWAGNLEIGDTSTQLDGQQERLKIIVTGVTPEDLQPPPVLSEFTQSFLYTGVQIQLVAPDEPRFKTCNITCIGAGGGPDRLPGGRGGYSSVTIATTPGQPFTIIVGQGGVNLTNVFGFGGRGQGVAHQHNGGGLSGVFAGHAAVTAGSRSRAICIAGGGGAGSWNGSTGSPGGDGNGVGGNPDMQGTNATGNATSGLGGGGGGYSGGASGRQAGAGGSGYVTPNSVKSGVMRVSTSNDSPAGSGQSGFHGRVDLRWGDESSRSVSPTTVWMGATDENGFLIGRPFKIFQGTLEPAEFHWGAGNNAIQTVLDIRGAPVAYEGNTAIRYTHEDQQLRFPGDLGLQYYKAVESLAINSSGNQI